LTSPLSSSVNIHHYDSTNCHYTHIWSGSPQYLSPVHDRYPAIYVTDHIWKCTADRLSRLVQAAILKSDGVLEVFSGNLKTPRKKFLRFNALKKSTSVLFSLQGYSEVEKMLLQAKQKLQTYLVTESCKVKQILVRRKRTYSR